MAFHIGQKVVCVRPELRNKFMRMFAEPLVKGNIYTIEKIVNSPSGAPHYTLEEIKTKGLEIFGTNLLFHYGHSHFEPLVEKGIEVFTAILENPKKKIPKDQFDKKKSKPRKTSKESA